MADLDLNQVTCTCVWDGVPCQRRADLIFRIKKPPYYEAYCSRCRQRARPHGKEALGDGDPISEDEAVVSSVMEEPSEPKPEWKWPSWKPRPKQLWPKDELFTLRMYDHYDGWIDIAPDLKAEEAERRWLEETKGGTEHFKYMGFKDYYYDIFPSDTRMAWNSEMMDP